MAVIDILTVISISILFITCIFLIIAKKRIDRNEPVWGWKRKQFLEEQRNGGTPSTKETKRKKGSLFSRLFNRNEDRSHESIIELLELKNIEQGVVERERNEYLLILNSDFVNFHFLQPEERMAILEGYQQLFNVINFPIQLLGQAVRQDFSKDRFRFEQNLMKCNEHARNYNRDVLDHIQEVTENDFRITSRIYYVVKYVYEPSKLGKLTPEQRKKAIINNIGLRAEIVRRTLLRAKVEARILDSVEAAEVYKRALNRDRMTLHPIEDVRDKEKLSLFVTMDFRTIPGFEQLVNDPEEALKIVGFEEEGETESSIKETVGV